jgi:hypothetical protein
MRRYRRESMPLPFQFLRSVRGSAGTRIPVLAGIPAIVWAGTEGDGETLAGIFLLTDGERGGKIIDLSRPCPILIQLVRGVETFGPIEW